MKTQHVVIVGLLAVVLLAGCGTTSGGGRGGHGGHGTVNLRNEIGKVQVVKTADEDKH